MTTTTTTTTTTARGARGPVRTPDDVARLGTVLGVWAHPDDEMYLAAGVMAAAAAAGHRVVVVTATRGERGTDDPARLPPARLAALRTRETAAGLAVVDGGTGRVEHRFLGDRDGLCYLDGELAYGSPDRAIAELAAAVDEVEPDTVLTFGPDGMTGHPDHRAVSAWTDRALARASWTGARLLHAVVTAEWVAALEDVLVPMDDGEDVHPVADPPARAVDLVLGGADLDRKLDALAAHASQTGPLRAAVGEERYRGAVAGEWFRAAP